MKIAVLGLIQTSLLSYHHLYSGVGGNTGNLMFFGAVHRQLQADITPVGYEFDAAAISDEFDAMVIPAANWLNAHEDRSALGRHLAELSIPVIVIGLGAQASLFGDRIDIHPGNVEFARIVADKAAFISTRGWFTTELLHSWGIDNVVTTGCPSLYLPQAGRGAVAAEDRRGVAVAPTRQDLAAVSFPESGIDPILYALAGRRGLDVIYQSEWEEIDHLVFGEAATLRQRLPEGLLAWAYGKADDAEALAFVEEHGRVFLDLDTWSRYLSGKKGMVGTRLHGSIIALNSGVPAVLIPHDTRTAEVAQFAGIPTATRLDSLESWTEADLEALLADADVAGFHRLRAQNQPVYVDFLRANGLVPEPSGFAEQVAQDG